MAKPVIKHYNNRKYKIKKWGFVRRAIFRFLQAPISFVLRKGFRFEAFGLEHLNKFPEGNGIILSGNHRSHLDGIVLATALLPPNGKRRFLATITPKKTLDNSPIFRFVTKFIGTFPIDMDKPQSALDFFYESVENGSAVLLFPQGGRVARTPVEDYNKFTEEGRTGVGRMILRSNGRFKVLPFYMHGTAEALGMGSILPRFGSYLSIRFGEVLSFGEYAKEGGWKEDQEFFEKSREITNKIMLRIQELCYETEKPVFDIIEAKMGKPINQIILTENQSRAIRKFLRRYSRNSLNSFNQANAK